MACLYPTGYSIFPQKPLNDRLLSSDDDWPRFQTVVRSRDNSVIGVYTCMDQYGCVMPEGCWGMGAVVCAVPVLPELAA